MGRQRRKFSAEYKDEAVGLVVNTGRPVDTVARELGINEATLGRWVGAYRVRHDTGVRVRPHVSVQVRADVSVFGELSCSRPE